MVRLQQQVRKVPGTEVHISTSLTGPESERLLELAKDKLVLEVGSYHGYSTVLMATVARHVISIDPFDGFPEIENTLHISGSGMQDRITLIAGRSQDILPLLRYGFDLVFIDGDHRMPAVMLDLVYARTLLTPNGTLAVHDAVGELWPDVRTAIESVFKEEGRLTDTLWEWPAN